MTALLIHWIALAIAAGALGAAAAAVALIAKRMKPGRLRDALTIATTLIGIGVRAAAKQVADLKDPAKDGDWSRDVGRQIKATVIAEAKAAAPDVARTLAQAAADPAEAEALFSRLVESELAKLKAAGAA